jgi:RND family efflux transporter MFP subunit
LQAAEAVLVTAERFDQLAFSPLSTAPATVISRHHSQLSAELNAQIAAIPVRVGDRVDAKTILVSLDCDDYHFTKRQHAAALQATRARLEFADYRLQRARSLQRSDAVSEEALRQRQSEVAVLKAEINAQTAALEQATLHTRRCDVRAPFTGVVVSRTAQLGEWASPGKPLIELLGSEALEVSAQIQAARAAEIADAKSIWFEAQGTQYPLQLRSTVSALDSRTRTQEVRLYFIDQRALPGSAGRLNWRSSRKLLPAQLIELRDDKLGVFVLEKEQARFVIVPDAEEGRPAAVSLPPDAMIAVEGRANLVDGSEVRIDQ